MSPDDTSNGRIPDEKASSGTISHAEHSGKPDFPTWFIRLFLIMLLVVVLTLWIIPDHVLLRWSMWWNNIPFD